MALDTSVLDNDQVENLIKFCPTKEEIEMLKVIFFSCFLFSPYDLTYLPNQNLTYFYHICASFFPFLTFQGYNGNREMLGKCEQVSPVLGFTQCLLCVCVVVGGWGGAPFIY